MSTATASNQCRTNIKLEISCPHCWYKFPTHQILFISASPNLLGDPKLGHFEQLRFLPCRFGRNGVALDSQGKACSKLACPNCHLPIPRSLLSTPSFFISIAGAPASGKSYFFTSMVRQLRKTMTQCFCMSFEDADPTMNRRILDYEGLMMGDEPFYIEKTDVASDNFYNKTLIDGHLTLLAQPFSYTIQPQPEYPFPNNARRIQTVCMYDNAGEHFLPDADNLQQPVTRHLSASDPILFLFDPTQDPRFRRACKQAVNDPQMNSALAGDVEIRGGTVDQSIILTEMIKRIKEHTSLSVHEKIKPPLIIVLTKLDAWKQLVESLRDNPPWNPSGNTPSHVYRFRMVEQNSRILRDLLLRLIPNLVAAAEANAANVSYIAVSATGTAPELGVPDANGKRPLLYRPANIKPIWIDVPLFHAQFMAGKYCFPIWQR